MKIRLSMELEYSDELIRSLAEKQWALLEPLLKKLLGDMGVEVETSLNSNEELESQAKRQALELKFDRPTKSHYYTHPTHGDIYLVPDADAARARLDSIIEHNIFVPFEDDVVCPDGVETKIWSWVTPRGGIEGMFVSMEEAAAVMNTDPRAHQNYTI